MPSTQQSSDLHTLDDDAVLALLAFAEWDVKFDHEDVCWLIKPPVGRFTGYVVCGTLQDAADYFLLYKRLYDN
jgi:hypothetical protein